MFYIYVMNRLKFLPLLLLIFFSFDITAQQLSAFDGSEKGNMTQRWELDSSTRKGTFLITPYKPVFVLPVKWSVHPNERPYSGNENPDYVAPEGTDFNNIESKFQLSFKVKILQKALWGTADLWVAYTQKAHWQIYNNAMSRPFREINYEPEVILNFPTKFSFLGINARMFGVAFNHESNGKSLPYSRSWNRIIFHAGFETGNWSMYLRPWLRLRSTKDDNPDITRYIGNGEVNVIYSHGESIFSFIGTNNLDFGKQLRGNATFSWSYPIQGNLKGYLQVSHGFGETLIDYNNVQTTVGIGISLVEWL